jgi:PAS domain S-box-containing protein
MFHTPIDKNQPRSVNIPSVLIVDSCPTNIQTYRQYLEEDKDHDYQISEALTRQDAQQLWRSHDFDVMILAINLADGSGLDLLREINNDQVPVKLPVIILTPLANQELVLEAMKLGASDYFITENIIADTFCRAVWNLAEQAIMGKKILSLKKQEEIIGKIALAIRQLLDLEKIYQTVVTEVQAFLQVDRVLIYKFESNMNWQIMAEKVVPPWLSCLERNVIDQCFQTDLHLYYKKGNSSVISDVNTANLTECHRQLLKQFQVQANIVAPIILPDYEQPQTNILWGLLIVHQCSHPRSWHEIDLHLLEKLSVQIGVALQQAELYTNLQNVNNSLEQRVAKRTEELENLLLEYQKAEEKLQLQGRILDEINDAVFSFDVDGTIKTWNKAATKLYGYQPEEIIGRSFSILCHAPNEINQKVLNPLLAKGEYQLESLARSKNGKKIDVDIRLSLIKDEQGNVTTLLGCSHDITDRKRAETALKNSELRFRRIFDSNVVGMFFADYAGNLINANDRFLSMLGYTREEFVQENLTWQKITPPEYVQANLLAHNFLTIRGVIDPWENQYYHQDGSRLSVLVGAALLPETEYQAIYIIVDISDRKEIEIALQQLNEELEARVLARTAALQKSESSLQDVLQFARITNWQLDPITKKYTWSPEILNILRVCPEDKPRIEEEMSTYLTLESEQLRKNLIDRLIKYGEPYVTNFQIIRGDGTIGHVLSKAKPEFNEEGAFTMITGIVMDISEWQTAEENFRKSEQRFTTLANNIPVAIFCLNQQGECVYVNNFWSQITGYSLANTLGQVWWQAVHPDDRQRIHASWSNSLTRSSSYQTEGRMLKPDGSICWFYCQIVQELDIKGKLIGYIGTLTDISDRKANEQSLRNLSTRLELAVQSAQMGIWEYDLIHDQSIWDSQMYKIFNISPSEIDVSSNILAKFYRFIHPDDLAYLMAEIEKVKKREKPLDTEYRIIWQDGTVRHIKVIASLYLDENQQPKSLIGVNYDITDRKMAEQEILRSRDLWQAVFNESADAVFLVNSDTLKFIDCNVRSVEMFEANSKDDLMGLRGNDLHKKKLTNLEIQDIYDLMSQQGFWNAEIEYISLKGKTFWGNVFVKPIVVAGQRMNLVRVTDISDRKQAEIALKESQKFIETVLETIPVPFFWKDRNSVFLGCNNLLSQFIGLTPQDIIGKSTSEITPLESDALAYQQDDQEVMASGQAKLAYLEIFITPNGETRWFESHKAPLRDGENNIIGIVGMSQDITERKQVADELKATNIKLAEATRLKDQFLANMSHELRTPLNAIFGMSEGLLEGVFGEISPTQARAIRLIGSSGKHLLDLINDILDISKIESGEFTLEFDTASVPNLCHHSCELLEQLAFNKNIQLSIEIVTEIEYIWVDERRIRQVLINLLNNAVKFTPTGGKVSLVVTDNQTEILFSVIDTGIGIDAVNLEKIFQPFIQIDTNLNRQYPGTGLGLSLVQSIVSQHEGSITVQSTIGEGSCFTICLPYFPLSMVNYVINQSREENTNNTTNNTNHQGRLPLILLADDHEGNRQTIEEYLTHKGYRIILAENGEEAITLAETHRPDIILMDIQMPNISGLEAITIIKNNNDLCHIPIIAITALALPGDREKCLKVGANEYLTKPIKFKVLLDKIENFLSLF